MNKFGQSAAAPMAPLHVVRNRTFRDFIKDLIPPMVLTFERALRRGFKKSLPEWESLGTVWQGTQDGGWNLSTIPDLRIGAWQNFRSSIEAPNQLVASPEGK